MPSPSLANEPRTFLACLDCGVLEPNVSRRDRPAASGVFLSHHARHRTRQLQRRALRLSREQRWQRRDHSTAFAASDGENLYVVTHEHVGHGTPTTYQVRPAALLPTAATPAVDSETLRRGLASALFPYRLGEAKFTRFCQTLHDIVGKLAVPHLDVHFEAEQDPSSGIARLPETAYAELLSQSAPIFASWEWPRVENFLTRDRDGLLAIRVHRELAALDA